MCNTHFKIFFTFAKYPFLAKEIYFKPSRKIQANLSSFIWNCRIGDHSASMYFLLYLTEARKECYFPTDDVLFISQTYNLDVKFTSDYSVTNTGFRLNIRSISCADRKNFQQMVVNRVFQ